MKMEHTTRKRRQGTAGSNRSLLVSNQSVQGRRNTGNSISDSVKKKPLPLPLRKTVSQISPRTCSDLSGQESDDGVDIEVEVDLERDGTAVVEKVSQQQDDDGDNKKKIDEIHAMPMSAVPSVVEECPEDDGDDDDDEEEEEEEEEEERICDNKNKRMQNIVDLVMWRDVLRSAFVFGIGSFLVISSSYTKDFNFSLISTLSYLGLFYLGTIFLYTSIARCDGTVAETSTVLTLECRERKWVITEEDATQLIYKLLPYINDILTKTKTLFSGDPATTIKAATPLFLLARYGGIVPISTMLKLAFFGAFTLPRLVSAYSVHIQRYATFLLHRSRDAWDTCTHKKAAAATTFAVLWNLSSPPARTWIVFMMLVFVRYYYQITGCRDLAGDLTTTSATEERNGEKNPPGFSAFQCAQ